MGTGASFAYDTDGLLKPEQVQNARLQQDMLDYVAQLDRKGMKDKLRAEFVDTGLEGTWIESFYNSDLVIAVSDIDESTAGNIDTTKYVASVSGTYKSGQGTIKGLLLHTRKTAHGIWREGDNEGLFQFDVVEDGLVFCGPFFHNGAYMGTWWGRNAQIGRFEEAVGMGVTAEANEVDAPNATSADNGGGGGGGGSDRDSGSGGGAAASTAHKQAASAVRKEFMAREEAARQEQAEAAAAKKRALQERVARRKQQSGRVIPPPTLSASVEEEQQHQQHERVVIDQGMVEDLLFDPNLEEEEVAAKMQASVDTHAELLGKLFGVGSGGAPTMPRAHLWTCVCSKVEALSIDEDDVGVMVGKVFREDGVDDDDDPDAAVSRPQRDTLEFVHFVHFLFHLSNAYTLMHEGMLGSDHSLDKVLPVLRQLLN